MSQAIKKPELEEFGKRLRELREAKGSSQKLAANELGLKQSTLSSYEVGDREPSITTLNKLAKTYGVTVDYLTGNNEHKTWLHEDLLNSKMISSMIIDKVIRLSVEEDESFLEVALCGDGFTNLLSALRKYKDLSDERALEIRDWVYSDEQDINLRDDFSASDFKKIVSKKLIDEAVRKMLIELDELARKEQEILEEFGHTDDDEV
jgi:transcriptional regulator with XRE-family HTH domain